MEVVTRFAAPSENRTGGYVLIKLKYEIEAMSPISNWSGLLQQYWLNETDETETFWGYFMDFVGAPTST